jgi:hypothetical protein
MYGTAHYNSAQYNTGGGLFVELLLSETSTISEMLRKMPSLSIFAESVTAADTVAKSILLILNLAESFGISDVVIKEIRMELDQAVNLGDGASTQNQRTFTESVTPDDTLLGQAIKTCLEFQFLFDSVEFRREKTLGETVKLNDWLTVGKDSNPWS